MLRFALVTGAGQGIGLAAARKLAALQFNVALVDRNRDAVAAAAASLSAGASVKAIGLACDVSSAESVAAAFASVHEWVSAMSGVACVDAVVNCAGITRDGFATTISERDWDDVLDVNLKGTFLVCQAAARAMTPQAALEGSAVRQRAIVNISSIVGKAGNRGQANYSASKGGVISLTKTLAKELAKSSVRVNCVLPGFVATPMAAAVPPKVIERMRAEIPMGRIGTPEEVAEAIAFLATPQSSYVTGAALEVSGGLWA